MRLTFRKLVFWTASLSLGSLISCAHQNPSVQLAPGPDSSNHIPGVIVEGHARTFHPAEPTTKTVRIYSAPTPSATPAPAPPPPKPAPPPKSKPGKTRPLPLQKDIFFAFNSSRISYANKSVLRAYAKLMKSKPKLRVILYGHTDPVGTERYNKKLGYRRALAARKILLTAGIAPKRIRVISKGKAHVAFLPTCRKPHALCYARNRAVRIRIVGQGTHGGIAKTHTSKKKK
jgi:outer membrane protein OmpA-like peptidoglycan-associated protein